MKPKPTHLKPKNLSPEKLSEAIKSVFEFLEDGNSLNVAFHRVKMNWSLFETRQFMMANDEFFKLYAVYMIKNRFPTTWVRKYALDRFDENWLNERITEALG